MADTLFSALLKYWRGRRGMSQLDLAMAAEVSARHVSFLESGRARPSEAMVLRLLSTLNVPLRDQNEVLSAASFAPRHPEPDLDALAPEVEQAIARMLQQQEPFPMTVMDAAYNLLRSNTAARTVFSRFVRRPAHLQSTGQAPATPLNLYALVFDPDLARPFIRNWAQIGHSMVARLHREALLRHNDSRLWILLDQVLAYPEVPQAWRHTDFAQPTAPTLPLELARDGICLRFFTVVTAFAAPQHITLDELRLESYFACDDATRATCEAWKSGTLSRDASVHDAQRGKG